MATKEKSVFFCKSCGNESPKWFGKCPACGEWNTCVEEKVSGKSEKLGVRSEELTTLDYLDYLVLLEN